MTVQWQFEAVSEDTFGLQVGSVADINLGGQRILIKVTDSSHRWLTYETKAWGEFGVRGQILLGSQLQLSYSSEYQTDTMTWPYRNYYANDPSEWTAHLTDYRAVMHSRYSSVAELMRVLIPIFEQLGNGIYVVSFRDMVPSDGSNSLDAMPQRGVSTDNPATRNVVFSGLDTRSIVVDDAFPLYLIPTEAPERINWAEVAALTQSEDLGFGVAYEFEGYTTLLLDGHHRALAAQRRGELLPCVVITASSNASVVPSEHWQEMSECSDSSHVTPSRVHGMRFLDLPDLELMARLSEYASESASLSMRELPLMPQVEAKHALQANELLDVVLGLFFFGFENEFLSLAPLIRQNYPSAKLNRRYYELMTNWLPMPTVANHLYQFLSDDLSRDESLNTFVAIRLAAYEQTPQAAPMTMTLVVNGQSVPVTCVQEKPRLVAGTMLPEIFRYQIAQKMLKVGDRTVLTVSPTQPGYVAEYELEDFVLRLTFWWESPDHEELVNTTELQIAIEYDCEEENLDIRETEAGLVISLAQAPDGLASAFTNGVYAVRKKMVNTPFRTVQHIDYLMSTTIDHLAMGLDDRVDWTKPVAVQLATTARVVPLTWQPVEKVIIGTHQLQRYRGMWSWGMIQIGDSITVRLLDEDPTGYAQTMTQEESTLFLVWRSLRQPLNQHAIMMGLPVGAGRVDMIERDATSVQITRPSEELITALAAGVQVIDIWAHDLSPTEFEHLLDQAKRAVESPKANQFTKAAPETYLKVQPVPSAETFVKVQFYPGGRSYTYLGGSARVLIGDHVLVPTGPNNLPKVARVVSVAQTLQDKLPFPNDRLKRVIGKV
ncbi:hypothetical protein [Lacticaseibacillus absianus]|uniref:hypothetical protein n=1 Tax=Lacticaseibacillus absianus TaxID=2729623 RepID=UPI0015C847D2|nr:hypothetical protein [Lacticaseibacillus absianus]